MHCCALTESVTEKCTAVIQVLEISQLVTKLTNSLLRYFLY